MKSVRHFDRAALHENAAKSIDREGLALLGLGTKEPFKNRLPDPFPTRQKLKTITDKDIEGEPKLSYTDRTGRTVAQYFVRDRHEIGLFDEGYAALRRLVELTLKAKPFNKGLSTKFVEEQIFNWWKDAYGLDTPASLTAHLFEKADEAVSEHHLLVPLSAIEIERSFEIGDVLVAPMDLAMLKRTSDKAKEKNPDHAEIIDQHFDKLTSELGHLTVVHVKVVGEPEFAEGHAEQTAFQIAEMFRFMSPAALSWNVAFPCFPHGCYQRRALTTLIIVDDKINRHSQGALDHGLYSWRLKFVELDRYMKSGFSNFSVFFESSPLTQFQTRVGKAISAFSEGVATHNVNNRLVYAMSALEHLLLKNGSEPIQSNVGERIAFLIAEDVATRRAIIANFSKAYALRSKQVHHLSAVDDENVLAEFFKNAWLTLHRAMQLMSGYEKHADFIDAIDNVKFGGG
ncbi:HEPN domain-containing protein [Sphingorhabdus sp. YGSMI21]|uniref:HEPN domain-containing protein n=1 Tax=Sphingorhabdus sp. YGSMI21 TaxID=2077182 RepID=UPI000C1E422B|nr:HEPN domain-containing protein [Sphingorhabdus sp. YGSMI21]ATW02454.1 hypothetical protein CHN51_02145 [Sphingorhabdus sp. YGSMI21]